MKKLLLFCVSFILGFGVVYGINSTGSSSRKAQALKVSLTPGQVRLGKTEPSNSNDSVMARLSWDVLPGYVCSLTLSNAKNSSSEKVQGRTRSSKTGVRSMGLTGRQLWRAISRMGLSKDTAAVLRVTLSAVRGRQRLQRTCDLKVCYKNIFSLPPLSGDSIRIASYNLLFEKTVPAVNSQKWVSRRVQVERLFRACHLDIVGTQEALTRQVNDLLSALPDYARLGTDLWGSFSAGNENEALFYNRQRLSVLESGEFWYSTTPDKAGSYSWGATYPRMCIWGKFREKSTGKVFFVFNSHFHVDFPQSRLESAKLLLSYALKQVSDGYPVICTGDFNSDDRSPALQVLLDSGCLFDARKLSTFRSGTSGTYHGFDLTKEPWAELDHVFVSKGISVGPYYVVDEELRTGQFGSDHLPVITDVKLP